VADRVSQQLRPLGAHWVQFAQELLERARPMLIGGDPHEVVLDYVHDVIDMVRLGHLDQLLAQVVGELVSHEDGERVHQHR